MTPPNILFDSLRRAGESVLECETCGAANDREAMDNNNIKVIFLFSMGGICLFKVVMANYYNNIF